MARTGSVVQITYDGTDITAHVMFETARFESQFSAIAGTFEFTCKDVDQTLSFITGREVALRIDGTLMFGGYLTQVTRKFAFPVDRTDADHGGVAGVKSRMWVLRGVDYNILFDKRVVRASVDMVNAAFLSQLDNTGFYNDTPVEDLIGMLCSRYLDLPSGLDYTSEVDYPGPVIPWEAPHTLGAWVQQGTPWRKQMEDLSQFNGAIWYIKPNKHLFFQPIENVQSRWGFSDAPNHRGIAASPMSFQGATFGFRELDASEDGSYITNDAFVWGGSEWAGAGGTIFARRTDQGSIDAHSRWQLAETHFGEFGIQEAVDARAQTIVFGGSGQENQEYGLRNPQWQFRFGWFGHDVPEIDGVRDHLTPGMIVPIILYTFGADLQHPLFQIMPLRQILITFPELDSMGHGYVKFEGFFGLQLSDPWTLWRYLLQAKNKALAPLQVSSASNASSSVQYGALGWFYPAENPDGTRTDFTIYYEPNGVVTPLGYISGTVQVAINGSQQRPGIDFVELDPLVGKVRFIMPPKVSDWIVIECRTMAG